MNEKKIDKEPEARIDSFLRHLSEYSSILTSFECIFNAIPDGAVFADMERRIMMLNPAMETLFGYRKKELIGRKTKNYIQIVRILRNRAASDLITMPCKG